MRRALGLAAAVAMLLAACGGSGRANPSATVAADTADPIVGLPSDAPLQTPAPVPSPPAFVPTLNEAVPRDPAPLAQLLADTTTALRTSVDGWLAGGDPSKADVPRALVFQALYQQRIYRALGRDASLRAATLDRIPSWLRDEARANANAHSRLFSLVHPLADPSSFRTQRPMPADVLLAYFEEGQRRFGVPWELLAAVNFVESKFGRVRSSSSAGAQGPMQFLPSTWAAYGLGGDIHDPRDAVLGAANYLHASGSPGDDRKALFAYNHSDPYVDAVSIYANRMSRDARSYYEYYNWQVFVLTVDGDRRMSGPWPR